MLLHASWSGPQDRGQLHPRSARTWRYWDSPTLLGACKKVQQLWKTVWQCSKKLNISLWPISSTSRYLPKEDENMCSHKGLYVSIPHSSNPQVSVYMRWINCDVIPVMSHQSSEYKGVSYVTISSTDGTQTIVLCENKPDAHQKRGIYPMSPLHTVLGNSGCLGRGCQMALWGEAGGSSWGDG